MFDSCEVNDLTLEADAGCQWDRAVTLWNHSTGTRLMLIATVLMMVAMAVWTVQVVAQVVGDYRHERALIRRSAVFGGGR
jgi:hypothetical protein